MCVLQLGVRDDGCMDGCLRMLLLKPEIIGREVENDKNNNFEGYKNTFFSNIQFIIANQFNIG